MSKLVAMSVLSCFLPILLATPALNPTWTGVGSCLIAFALIVRHSAKFRK